MENVRTWAEINIDNIISNYNNLRDFTECKRVMAVIKADAYGHGAVEVAKALSEVGCDFFAVAALDEALQLRKANISSNILVLGYSDIASLEIALSNGLFISVYNSDYAKALNEIAKSLGMVANIHIKIDTGMTRFGFDYKVASSEIEKISKMSNLRIDGIYTHFASADESDSSFTYSQFEKYMSVVKELEDRGIEIPLKHVANSAATLKFKEMHLDIVRCGVTLFGCYPSEEVNKSIELKPAMILKSKIVRLQNVKEGTSLSYGRAFTTDRDSLIATLSIGYADGFTRLLFGKASVCMNNEYAKVVGKICMDSCMVDVTDFKQILKVEDVVEIFGENISVEKVASEIGTINYEILCMVSKRVPRAYIVNGEQILVKKYLI